ncbi:protein [Lentinula edodes]|uniref:Protein n=1 Tax=Lentinula edodes TaxID=5353 RepID=A0A1Q3DZQ4_LENED|nr:protein [Lentinula edodes]
MEDAENIKKDPSRFYTWYNVAGPAEDEKRDESSREHHNKNVAQIVYNLQQIMSLDPCRRFTFGMSMRDRELRLWFAFRGFVLTTNPCDFLKDHARLVHLFISFVFSSRTDFSWDPTITCTDPAFNPSDPRKRRVYSIEVRNDQGEVRWFETIRILANYAADSTVSSATRVRLVRDEQGVQYVLKDVWLHMDRLPEHEIRAQILADAFKYCGAADQATLKRHLLTPHVCGKVFVNDGVDTTDGMMYQELPAISSDSIFTLKLGKISNPLRQSRDPASASETHPGSLREITTSRKSQMRKSAIQTPRLPS